MNLANVSCPGGGCVCLKEGGDDGGVAGKFSSGLGVDTLRPFHRLSCYLAFENVPTAMSTAAVQSYVFCKKSKQTRKISVFE